MFKASAGPAEARHGPIPELSPRIEVETPTGQIVLCLFYSFGILVSLVAYGILQEKIMTVAYGGEIFTVSTFLVFCNRLLAIAFSMVVGFFRGLPSRNQAPIWKYSVVSLSNVGASVCQYETLKYVTFTVQMVGKSFKIVPVMLWGVAIGGKCFSLMDVAVAGGISGGTLEFLLTGDIERQEGGIRFGLILLLAYLTLDGLTSTFQEKLFRENFTSKYNQMLFVNLGAVVISGCALVVTEELLPSVAFCVRHPEAFWDMTMLSAASVSAQWFIYSQLKEFGALVFAITINVRQVASILCSFVVYRHPIVREQVIGLAAIFVSVFFKSWMSLFARDAQEKAPLMPRQWQQP